MNKVVTKCDFGETNKTYVVCRHTSIASAMRQYRQLWDIYHRLHGYRVWIELVKPETK